MKKLLFVYFIFIGTLSAQNLEPKDVVTSFFTAFHAKDTIALKQFCHEEIVLRSISNSKEGTQLSTDKIADFLESIAKIPQGMQFEERLLDYKVEIDGNLAHVWTPYEFYINGKFSHQGANAFTLYNENGKWVIIHLIDTRRK